MIRFITRTILILVACVALALVVVRVVRASGPDYSQWPVSNATQPVAGALGSQNTDGGSGSGGDATSAPSGSAAGLPNTTARPQGGANPLEQEMYGTVASSDSAHSAFTLTTPTGTVIVLVTPQTEFSDGINALANVHAGMHLSVEGNRQADGRLMAGDVKVSNGAGELPEPQNTRAATSGD